MKSMADRGGEVYDMKAGLTAQEMDGFQGFTNKD